MNANNWIKNHGSMSTWITSICVGALATMFSAQAASPDNRGQLDPADYKFAVAAARGGVLEVNLGKLAQEKAGNDAVKHFGQQMVEQHGKAGADLERITEKKGATVSTGPTAAQQREIDRLNKLSGADFDKAYIAFMVKDHKADLKEFQNAALKVNDNDLKAFAAATVPMIEDHLKMALAIQETLGRKQVSENISD